MLLVTSRNSSCGKVMFSQVSVKSFCSAGGGGLLGISGMKSLPGGGRGVPTPHLLTPSGGHIRSVGKRVVRILLECFLVFNFNFKCDKKLQVSVKYKDFIVVIYILNVQIEHTGLEKKLHVCK